MLTSEKVKGKGASATSGLDKIIFNAGYELPIPFL